MEAVIYDQKGKESGKINLPEDVFALSWNADLVHQVVVSQMANKRTPIAHSKDRGAVRGGGRKPWRQKGTGQARVGSNRSPIWRGGGVTFGPTNEKNYSKKINKKMKTKALYVVLSKKLKDGEVLFLNNFDLKESKTKEAKAVLDSIKKVSGFERLVSKKKNSAVIALSSPEEQTSRGLRNFANINVVPVKNLNPTEILSHKYLIITNPVESVEILKSKSVKAVKVAGPIKETRKVRKIKTAKTIKTVKVKKTPAKKKVAK